MEVIRDGVKMKAPDFGSRKAKTLLRWLADRRNDTVLEEVLLDALWPDSPHDKVLRSLRVRVSEVRKLLAPTRRTDAPLERVENGYILRTVPGWLETDVDRFVALTSKALQMQPTADAIPILQQCTDLYHGEYFSDDPYTERWYGPRERYRKLFVAVAERLAAIFESLGQYEEGIHLVQRLLNQTHADEALYRSLIRLQYLSGDQPRALRTFEECRDYLQSELGARPLPETLRLLKQVIQHAPLDPFPLPKGELTPPTHPALPTVHSTWPFLGRQGELAHLQRHITELQGGHGGNVWLHGTSGIGKTRLLKEAVRDASQTRRTRTLWIQGSYLNSRIPFAALVDALQTRLDPELADKEIQALAASCSPELRQVMGWSDRKTDVELQSAQSKPEAFEDLLLQQEMLRLFERLAGEVPLVICADDVQALDPASRGVLLSLARRVSRCPLLILMSSKRAPQADELGADLWEADALSSVIHVGPLSISALSPLAGKGLATPWTQRWLRQLHAETAGEPYTLIERLNGLRRERMIDVEEGEIVFPSGLFELMTLAPASEGEAERPPGRKNDFYQGWQALSDDGRSLLQKAAILRDPFTLERLKQLTTKPKATFQRALEQLIRQGYITIVGTDVAGNLKLSFAHSRLQRRTYHTMTQSERMWHHRRVLDLLEAEADASDSPSPLIRASKISAIAFHALWARDWERASRWSLKAAAATRSIFAGPEVVALCRQALQTAERTEPPVRDALLYEARSALAKALFHVGSYAEALPLFEALVDRTDTVDPLSLAQQLTTIYLHLNHFEKAQSLIDRVVARAGDNQAVHAWAKLIQANIHYRSGEVTKSISIVEYVLGDFQTQPPEEGILITTYHSSDGVQSQPVCQAAAHHQLALSYWELGEYGEALEHARRCVDLQRETGGPEFIRSLNSFGELYQDLFCPKLAHQVHREALDLALSRGKVSLSIEVWRNIGLNFVQEGRLEKGLQTLDRVWRQVQDLNLAPYWQENHLRSLLEANILAHRPREVRTLLERYKRVLGPRETPFVAIFSCALALLEGRVDEGEALLSQVRAFWEKTGRRGRAAHVLLFAGQELMLQAHNELSRHYLHLAINELDRICTLVPPEIARRIRASRQYQAAYQLLHRTPTGDLTPTSWC